MEKPDLTPDKVEPPKDDIELLKDAFDELAKLPQHEVKIGMACINYLLEQTKVLNLTTDELLEIIASGTVSSLVHDDTVKIIIFHKGKICECIMNCFTSTIKVAHATEKSLQDEKKE